MLFPQKLWTLINRGDAIGAVKWSEDGRSFHLDVGHLSDRCLDKENRLFRTRKPRSFIRQLYLYGFKKMPPDSFTHPFFQRGRPDLLPLVRRDYKGYQADPRTPVVSSTTSVQQKTTAIKNMASTPLASKNTNQQAHQQPLTSSTTETVAPQARVPLATLTEGQTQFTVSQSISSTSTTVSQSVSSSSASLQKSQDTLYFLDLDQQEQMYECIEVSASQLEAELSIDFNYDNYDSLVYYDNDNINK